MENKTALARLHHGCHWNSESRKLLKSLKWQLSTGGNCTEEKLPDVSLTSQW